MPEIVDLIKLLPNGGSIVAVIVIVILFLKQQDKVNDILKLITDKFNEQTAINQKNYQDQINNLSQQFFANQKSFQDQIQLLIDNHLKVSQQTVTALKGVEVIVRNLQDRVSKMQ